jgi:hypothetical protein
VTQEFHYFVKVMIICTVGCLMMLTVASMPVAQKSSLDHLIIPYEDSPVDYGVFVSDQGSQFKDEPTVSQSNGYFLVNILFDDNVIVVQTTHYTIYSRERSSPPTTSARSGKVISSRCHLELRTRSADPITRIV